MSGDSSSHHIVPIKTYFKVLAALLFFTFLTVVVARPVSGLDIGHWNTVLAVLIASAKAALVLAIFMGLKYDNKLHLAIFFAGIFFLVILFSFSILDIFTRLFVTSPL